MATTVFPPRSRTTAPQSHGIFATLATLIASWRYAGAKRDLRFDLLRGLAVIAMVTDHVGGQESWLYTLTGGNHFWTSAAEGFIFISGLVMGIVYPAVIARDGSGAAVQKAMRRTGTLYLLTVTLTLTTAALALRLGLHWAPQVDADTLPDFVVGVLTLHRSYYLTDVLLLYTLVIFIAAGALYLMATRRSWIVLAASWDPWSLWQFFPQPGDPALNDRRQQRLQSLGMAAPFLRRPADRFPPQGPRRALRLADEPRGAGGIGSALRAITMAWPRW